MLTGENGILSQARYGTFATKIGEYKDRVAIHVMEEQLNRGEDATDVNINITDSKEMKNILGDNSETGDENKYVIQNNELRYNQNTVTDQEEEWLIRLGILAMTMSTFLITFMASGSVYQTIQADKITFPEVNPTSTEGNFAGWYYEEEGTNQATEGTEITSDVTLYAKWENFKITFMFNGEVYSEISNDENKVIYPETPQHPQGNGFTFTGWYSSENGEGSVSNGQVVTKDTVLYPGWSVSFKAISLTGYTDIMSLVRETLAKSSTEDILNDSLKTSMIRDVFNIDLTTTEEVLAFQQAIEEGLIEVNEEIIALIMESYPEFIEDTFFENNGFSRDGSNSTQLYFNYNDRKNIEKYEFIDASVIVKDGFNQDITYDISNGVSVDDGGVITIDGGEYPTHDMSGEIKIKITYNSGKEDIVVIKFAQEFPCFVEGTKITLADMGKKNIEDIEYTDELLVWDFDNGCFAKAKPLWIKKVQVAEEYNLVKFNDGTELKTVADHRIFNIEKQKFTYTMDEEETPIGTSVFKEDGSVAKIVERSVVKEKVNYYNVITDYHMNLFANGLLTSLRLNNLYKIKDMKFVKDNRELTSREEFEGIPDKYFYGLRLAEQPKEINRGNDVKHTKTLQEYVKRLLPLEK